MNPKPLIEAAAAIVVAIYGYYQHKKEAKKAHDKGREEGASAMKMEFEKKLRDISDKYKGYKDFEKNVLAFYFIGISVANADGLISEIEQKELNVFLSGCSSDILPQSMLNDLISLNKNPPTFEQAISVAMEQGIPQELIEDIMEIVIHSDGIVNESERQLMATWEYYKNNYFNQVDTSNDDDNQAYQDSIFGY